MGTCVEAVLAFLMRRFVEYDFRAYFEVPVGAERMMVVTETDPWLA